MLPFNPPLLDSFLDYLLALMVTSGDKTTALLSVYDKINNYILDSHYQLSCFIIMYLFVYRRTQDFALDPDEARMRSAAHHFVRFMTAGMALITVHEPVLTSITTQLKQAFTNALRVSTHVYDYLIFYDTFVPGRE